MPGIATLNTGDDGDLYSLSCPAPGDCVAGGAYATSGTVTQAFVAAETSGAWGNAEEVPGTATLNAGGFAGVTSVSCAAPGDCVAGGYYSSASSVTQAFIAAETNGIWAKAEEVPGTATGLALSAKTISYGNESAEHLTVTVKPKYTGTPGGSVTVKAGTTKLCTITLKSGKGTCTLSSRQLKAH